MALETQQLSRAFRYNSVDLIDPGAQYTPEQVRDFYAPTYPEILNAAIEGPEEKDGKLVYTFRRAVGTKGVLVPMPPLAPMRPPTKTPIPAAPSVPPELPQRRIA